jgi:hypothetical protein
MRKSIWKIQHCQNRIFKCVNWGENFFNLIRNIWVKILLQKLVKYKTSASASILTTQEAAIRRIVVWSQPKQKVCELSSRTPQHKKGLGRVTFVVQQQPGKHEAHHQKIYLYVNGNTLESFPCENGKIVSLLTLLAIFLEFFSV